jgi:pimeloyl-ACP methyl ester carboxylesterase
LKRVIRYLLIALVALVLIVLVAPLLIPIPRPPGTVPGEALADPDSHFLDLNGVRVHYKQAGAGEPAVLLLHGFGSSTFSFREVMGPLAEAGTVVAFDRPGFGLTSRPLPGQWSGVNPYGLAGQEALTLALMDHLGIRRAVLVGHSAGGGLAMRLALDYPERVQGLVLIAPAVSVAEDWPGWIRLLFRLPQADRLGPLAARVAAARIPSMLPTAWHDPSRVTPEILAGYQRPLRVENWDIGLWQYIKAGGPSDLAGRLSEITVPTLVVTGDDDTWVATQGSVQLAGQIPGARLAILPDAGHVAHEEQPAAFLAAVLPFIRELGAQPTQK